jgi:hypothetical protein
MLSSLNTAQELVNYLGKQARPLIESKVTALQDLKAGIGESVGVRATDGLALTALLLSRGPSPQATPCDLEPIIHLPVRKKSRPNLPHVATGS